MASLLMRLPLELRQKTCVGIVTLVIAHALVTLVIAHAPTFPSICRH